MLDVISLKTPQRKWASSRLEGRTSGFSQVSAGALDLRQGPQGPAMVASGKASPHASCSGASRHSPLVDARGVRPCVESVLEPELSSAVLTWIWGTTGVSPGESDLVSRGGMHERFPPEL